MPISMVLLPSLVMVGVADDESSEGIAGGCRSSGHNGPDGGTLAASQVAATVSGSGPSRRS